MAKVSTGVSSKVASAAYDKWSNAWKRFNAIDKPSQSDRETFWSNACDALPIIREHNADNGKKVRRTLRASGYRISDRGYFTNAKRERKAKAKAVKPSDANANANDVVTENANA